MFITLAGKPRNGKGDGKKGKNGSAEKRQERQKGRKTKTSASKQPCRETVQAKKIGGTTAKTANRRSRAKTVRKENRHPENQKKLFLRFDSPKRERKQQDAMLAFTITERTIDLQEVIKEKAPALYRKMPGFLFPLLRKILHEKEVNHFLYKERDKTGIDFATAILEDFGCQTSLRGEKNLQADGRYLLCANHPLGGLDGMAFISQIGKIRKDLLFPVNDMLLALPPLQPVFLPISKLRKNTENRRALDEAFRGPSTLLYFPAGLCSRKQKKGVIADTEWKKTFITQARNSGRDIVPVHISGKNSNFFYNLARLRNKLGIKANIEQLFLVNEMFKLRNQKICLTLGKPIPYETFDRSRTDKEWAALVREHVYKLAGNPEADFTQN